ncbi:MAG: aspartate aminotransferase family protein [Bryobacteraceae bacterium]|nr:aspartate aminotransferase family protein [Bryobacteraceae bacterium]
MPLLLREALDRAVRYVEGVEGRRVFPDNGATARLAELGGSLPEDSRDPIETIRQLDAIASPATVATTGPRYFGFVTGGMLPAALGAAWLTSAWDQNGILWLTSPAAVDVERIVLRWMSELFGLPAGCSGALVTCATMASFTGLAAARHAVLERAGWDVEAEGLFGAPPLDVVVSDEVHSTVLKGLAMLGLGKGRVIRVPTDSQGRMIAARIPRLSDRSILCLQAGNVNTGSFDPLRAASERAREAGAWVHIDGAFGLWAAASPARRVLLDGVELADSWATDGHKWLNVGYDCGVVLVRDGTPLRKAMSAQAAYLIETEERDSMNLAPDSSRRARSFEVWAALHSLGRRGLQEMVDRCCAHAEHFARELRKAGIEVPHEVVLNQVLVRFGDDKRTDRVIDAIQRDGILWAGRTEWQGKAYMRISVSNWSTTSKDVERSLESILRAHSLCEGG